jgi:hypothetical protein
VPSAIGFVAPLQPFALPCLRERTKAAIAVLFPVFSYIARAVLLA